MSEDTLSQSGKLGYQHLMWRGQETAEQLLVHKKSLNKRKDLAVPIHSEQLQFDVGLLSWS